MRNQRNQPCDLVVVRFSDAPTWISVKGVVAEPIKDICVIRWNLHWTNHSDALQFSGSRFRMFTLSFQIQWMRSHQLALSCLSCEAEDRP
jgi:hypothetical protein